MSDEEKGCTKEVGRREELQEDGRVCRRRRRDEGVKGGRGIERGNREREKKDRR